MIMADTIQNFSVRSDDDVCRFRIAM